MEDVEKIQDTVRTLQRAYRTKEPIEPITPQFENAPLDLAYRIQQQQVAQWEADGDPIRGHKVGLSSRAMQRMAGVNEPDFGHLTESMFHQEFAPIDIDQWMQPRVEPEFAFVLKKPLSGPGVTMADAIAAVDFVLPALEVVDSRIRDWKIGIFDTVADNASSGGVILGSCPVKPTDIDLRLVGCNLHINGELVETGAGGAVLGSPFNALVWLANRVGPLGVTLEPGHVVLPGSVTSAYSISAGDTVSARFGGIGTVTAVFDHVNQQGGSAE